MNTKFLRLKSVIELTGLSRSTIYLMMSEGRFPNSISIGSRAIAWTDNEVKEWIEHKINKSKIGLGENQ